MLVSGERCFHFSWDGMLLVVCERPAKETCLKPLEIPECPDDIEVWLQANTGDDFEVVRVISTAVRENPSVWQDVDVVSVERANGNEHHSYWFDTQSRKLLAEFDLEEMYSSLYEITDVDLDKADVSCASLGPDGGLGFAVQFIHDGSHSWEVGVWADERWVPLPTPRGTTRPVHLIVGPGNRSVVDYHGYGASKVMFFDRDGALLRLLDTQGTHLQVLEAAYRKRVAEAATAVSISSLAAVAMLGLIWWLGPPKRAEKAA